MVVQSASVRDVLEMFHLGDATAEPELTAALRSRFGLADDADLADALRDVPPSEVLACLAAVAAPVAAMVRELYGWLAEFDGVRSTANLSVRLSDEQMTELTLDPEQYRAYEQAVVESVSKVGFDPSRLPAESPLYRALDVHWPPDCARPAVATADLPQCRVCRPEVAGEFKRFEQLLQAAAKACAEDSVEHHVFDGPRARFVAMLPRYVDELLTRLGVDPCAYTRRYTAEYVGQGMPDLAGCFHEVTEEEIRRFFDLPYWRARWQLYEVWLLHVVLSSYGTTRWKPNLTKGTWDLKAGSTNKPPVATAGLANGRELRCYYQHDSTPPGSLVPGTRDRPELLITEAHEAVLATVPGDDGEPVVLAAEAKTRLNYPWQDMKGSVYALLEWEPRRVLGASFFSLTGSEELYTGTAGSVRIALGDRLVPDSKATTALRVWLRRMWVETCWDHVTVIAVDVSGSMAESAATTKLEAMATIADEVDWPEWADGIVVSDRLYLAVFGAGRTDLLPLEELSVEAVARFAHRLQPANGAVRLRRAWRSWLDNLDRDATNGRLALHLVSDGRLNDDDIKVLHELEAAGHLIHVHLVERGAVTRRGLARYIV